MDTVKETTVGKYKVRVVYDTDPESPREWDNIGTFFSNHRRYNPDKRSVDEVANWNGHSFNIKRGYIGFPVYLLDHSGVWISLSDFNDPWDSGIFAIYAISRKDALKFAKECGLTTIDRLTSNVTKRILETMRGEVMDFKRYVEGEVYGYQIMDENDDVVDSCWGFYDEPDSVLKEAEGIAGAMEDRNND